MCHQDKIYMERAIALSKSGMLSGQGGPFGCVIVKDGEIIGEGYNSVLTTNDPTAHAEVVAIRNACQKLGHFQLDGCKIYTSCEPCPMCLGAIYWARPEKVYFANTKKDAAEIGFDDQFIYDEIDLDFGQRKILFEQLMPDEAKAVFMEWGKMEKKNLY